MERATTPRTAQPGFRIPVSWWPGIPLAGAVYALLKWVAPLIATALGKGSPLFSSFDALAPIVALPAALGVLLLWVAFVIERRRDDRRLDAQTGLDSIRELSWREFEQLLATAFRRRGFRVDDTGPGPDGGIDLVLHAGNRSLAVQAKHWKTRKVGVGKVRELLGATIAAGCDGAMLVTSGMATAEAKKCAAGNDIDLIEGEELARMILEVQRRPVDQVTPDPNDAGVPVCPTCGSDMVRRTARKGANAGTTFWGCSTFPHCRGTRPIP
jgi:restriction system protein